MPAAMPATTRPVPGPLPPAPSSDGATCHPLYLPPRRLPLKTPWRSRYAWTRSRCASIPLRRRCCRSYNKSDSCAMAQTCGRSWPRVLHRRCGQVAPAFAVASVAISCRSSASRPRAVWHRRPGISAIDSRGGGAGAQTSSTISTRALQRRRQPGGTALAMVPGFLCGCGEGLVHAQVRQLDGTAAASGMPL